MKRFKEFLVVWVGGFIMLPLAGILIVYLTCCFIKLEIIYPQPIQYVFLRVYLCITAFLAFFISIDR